MKEEKIVTDAMLGKLTRYLRMIGHDVIYTPDKQIEDDYEIEEYARKENRILLTRDKEINGTNIESLDIEGQLKEVKDMGIDIELNEPNRCSLCNSLLYKSKDRPEHIPKIIDKVWKCENCGKYYWKGSHWKDVKKRISKLD